MKIVLPALQCSRPYLEGVLPRPAAKSAAAALLSKCDSTERSDSSSDDEEGQDLCNCEFSLAYGAHTRQLRMCRVLIASLSQDLCICEFSLACSAHARQLRTGLSGASAHLVHCSCAVMAHGLRRCASGLLL